MKLVLKLWIVANSAQTLGMSILTQQWIQSWGCWMAQERGGQACWWPGFSLFISTSASEGGTGGHMTERAKHKHQGSFLGFCQRILREKGHRTSTGRNLGHFWLLVCLRREHSQEGKQQGLKGICFCCCLNLFGQTGVVSTGRFRRGQAAQQV